jgi:hypothetical protein
MPSPKQIEANRRNAQLSTGPTSAAGKAVSRMNALKTGIDAQSQIIRGEDPAALEQLTRQYYERFQPQGPEECDLIDTAISSSWLLRRLRKTEAEIWNNSIDWDTEHHPEHTHHQARAYAGADRTLDRCHTRIAAAERSLRVALETLARLRKQAPVIFNQAQDEALQPEPPAEFAEPVPNAETNPFRAIHPKPPILPSGPESPVVNPQSRFSPAPDRPAAVNGLSVPKAC